MKKILSIVLISAGVLMIPSCKKFLDINQNPNDPTFSTPELVLPQAITYTANNTIAFNNHGNGLVGYRANGGGVSGWGSYITYNYTNAEFSGLWSSTYDNLEDFQYVLTTTSEDVSYSYYNAAAKIMKAYNFQLLVDTYNDVPYFEAFRGSQNLQPSYDQAQVVYKELGLLLDSAISQINAGMAMVAKPRSLTTAADPLFKGDLNRWKQFANTIKLRLIIRADGEVAFDNTSFDAAGFLTDDAIVNPGYTKIDGKQNPQWDNFAYSAANAVRAGGAQHVPTPYILAFYDGTKILDTSRGKVVYKSWSGPTGGATAKNQLGYQGSDAARGLTPNSWFIGTSATAYTSIGIFKGPDAGQPLILAAESYLLQAEANLKGIVTGDAKTNFIKGIESSFRYLYKNAANEVPATRTFVSDAAKYLTDNTLSPLVNFDEATTDAQKLEAIITQKYIALNMIHSHESWNEFRRTGYPSIVAGSSEARETFASRTSEATAPNKLPARILYPESEFRYNQSNVPKSISAFTSKIFWAL